jgi:hypothetical protein
LINNQLENTILPDCGRIFYFYYMKRFVLHAVLSIFLLGQGLLTRAQSSNFPDSWAGEWEGTLSWYPVGTTAPRLVPMQLLIGLADSAGYTWSIQYGEGQKDQRHYLLLPVDSATGHWVIDERNGIRLDQFFLANRLSGAFTVGKSTIINNYFLSGDSLIVEFNTIGSQPLQESGLNTEESPRVLSYRVLAYQRAVLRRKQ